MHTHDTLQRRNRYRPSSTDKRVTLKDRDRVWLEFIARHGPQPSHFLHAVTEKMHPSAKATRMRLTDLASETNTPHGEVYLVRPAAQQQIDNARNKPLIYDLSEAGWDAIEKSRAETTRVSGPLRHQVMVACTTASIELACRERPNVSYIPASQILGGVRSLGVDLAIEYSGRPQRHRLVPDQLFALAYRTPAGTHYRAFVVECDRATEPVTSPNPARKSYLRSFLEYRTFIGNNLYKAHYGLKSPLLVLNVMTSRQRQKQFQLLVLRHAPQGNAYMLFKTVEAFGTSFTPDSVVTRFLFEPWERSGMDAIRLMA